MRKKPSFFNRITALFIVTAVLFGAVLSVNAFAAQSKQMTLQLFFEKLEAFKNDVYANGSRYKDRESEYMGIQCYGFANQIAKYFYGSWPTYDSRGLKIYPDWSISYGSEALQDLHIGDVVRFRSSAGADHSIFITGFDENKIYFSDANNDHHNTVRHNAEMTWEKLIGKMDKSLERDSSCIGWVAHYKYWDDDPEHAGIGTQLVFNANGGYIDGVQTATRYIVLDTLNVRSGPGTDYDRVGKMYDDSLFDVALGSETVEAEGYIWAEVRQGEKTGWSVISVDEWCRETGPVMSSDHYVGEKDGIIYKTSDSQAASLTVGEGKELPDAEQFGLTLDGSVFAGWSCEPGGEPTDMKKLLDTPHGAELTLYAVWTPSGNETETDGETTAEVEEKTVLRGDINGDGMVDNKDVVTLFHILSSADAERDPGICDVNRDGETDNKDLTYLFRMISSIGTSEPEEDTETEEQSVTEETEETETVQEEVSDETEGSDPSDENSETETD